MVFLLDIIDSNSLHGPVRELHEDDEISNQIILLSGARRKDLKVNYWDTPVWPIALRNHVWHVLFKEGADVLSVDDVEGCARANWDKKRRSWWEWWCHQSGLDDDEDREDSEREE
jgi:hypothetical protein